MENRERKNSRGSFFLLWLPKAPTGGAALRYLLFERKKNVKKFKR
jgi:hypothetical protein